MFHRPVIAGIALSCVVALSACGRSRSVSESASANTSACTHCHGGASNPTGAPSAGAHDAHVVQGAMAGAIGCGECHPDPRVDASHHGSGKIDVQFGPIASTGGLTPRYDAQTGCAAVYCHGSFPGGNASNTPRWTMDASGAQCGTCHGDPAAQASALPRSGHASLAPGSTNATCAACHPGTVDGSGNVIAAGGKHVNGVRDTDPAAKHPAGWAHTIPDWSNPSLHALAAAHDASQCLRCHATTGAPKVTTRVCASCHDGIAGGKDWTTTCNTCHGSPQNDAPPRDAPGFEGGTGAHQKHVTELTKRAPSGGANATCVFCHGKPANVLDAGHLDGSASVTGYTGADALWMARVKDPAWNATAKSCSASYCHGAFRNGNSGNAPVWTAGAQACGTCHGVPPPAPHPPVPDGVTGCVACHPGSVDSSGNTIAPPTGKHLDGNIDGGHSADFVSNPSSPSFHAYDANKGLALCQGCHGQDLGGGLVDVACASCHKNGGLGAPWGCTMCHGGTDNQTGAPPRATWGNGSDAVRVGAHTKHLTSTIAPAFDCVACHVKPADPFASGHIDGATATVTFGGAWGKGVGAWTRDTATCSNVYCHGNFSNGKTANAPVWTAGASQGTCGTCHALPPQGTHPAVASDLTKCAQCHNETMSSAGALIPPASGGKHLDGIVEAGGHDANWMNTSSPGFHAFSANTGLSGCTSCHGPALGGNGGVPGCASCHKSGGTGAPWGCTMCHGGADNQTGAPPKATWGHTSPADQTNVQIGAHTKHLTTAIAPTIGCEVCHVKPADVISAGHADGTTASITFTGQGTSASYNPTTATCSSTYCHGGFAPKWTGGSSQGTCGTCHGLPPQNGKHPAVSSSLSGCAECHSATVDGSGQIIPGGKHLNGVIEGGHDATTWMDQSSPKFHAYSANQNLAGCTMCHGASLEGSGTARACADCHGASWKTNCTMCHGGGDNQTGAPPRTTWGNSSDTVRIGAHTSHVQATHGLSAPLDCSTCHTKPADALAAGHVDAVVASVTGYTGADANFLAAASGSPGWNRTTASCSTSFCHSGTLPPGTTSIPGGVIDLGGSPALDGGSNTTPRWTTVDGSQAACGTCHKTTYPFARHRQHTSAGCTWCHFDVANDAGTAITNPAAHINGVVNVRDRVNDPECGGCHEY